MRMTVADLMCETPITVGPGCTTDEALEAFYEYETPELYVVDHDGRLLGVLPDYEVLKAELSGEAHDACVADLMSTSVPICKPNTDAAEVARMFRDSQISRIPVINGGRLIGVVMRADVIRVMAVLRRIDAQVKPAKSEPKRPKHLQKIASPSTRTAAPSRSIANRPPTGIDRSPPAASLNRLVERARGMPPLNLGVAGVGRLCRNLGASSDSLVQLRPTDPRF